MCQMKRTRALVALVRGRARRESAYAAARTATVPRREKTVVWSICSCTGAGGSGSGIIRILVVAEDEQKDLELKWLRVRAPMRVTIGVVRGRSRTELDKYCHGRCSVAGR